ncbi:hypothetical protein ACQP3J_32560, partial [Escherichia coli]
MTLEPNCEKIFDHRNFDLKPKGYSEANSNLTVAIGTLKLEGLSSRFQCEWKARRRQPLCAEALSVT